MVRLLILLLMLAVPVWPALAVQPDEVLADQGLEARARDISKGLRCTQCRNESIDESNADISRDLRLLVRERLVAGDSDVQVVDYIVSRYGEYVLLSPEARGWNWALWLAGPGMLTVAAVLGFGYLRQRGRAEEPVGEPLSDAETARLKEILKD